MIDRILGAATWFLTVFVIAPMAIAMLVMIAVLVVGGLGLLAAFLAAL